MSLKLTNVHIENCGTGVKADGKVDIEMDDMTFVNNGKDVDLYVEHGSNISINTLTSTGCKTESITYREYSNKITDIKQFVETKTEFFTQEEISEIRNLLDKMNNSKDNVSKIQKILKEIYGIGKATSASLLAYYIKMQFGW